MNKNLLLRFCDGGVFANSRHIVNYSPISRRALTLQERKTKMYDNKFCKCDKQGEEKNEIPLGCLNLELFFLLHLDLDLQTRGGIHESFQRNKNTP